GVRAVRGEGQMPGTDFPRRTRDRSRHRCSARVGEIEAMGEGQVMKRRNTAAIAAVFLTAFYIAVVTGQQAGGRPSTGSGQAARGGGGRGGPQALPFDQHPGFVSIFDGSTLKGWDGDSKFWRVEGGAIVGQTTAENPLKENSFLIWRGGEPGDFELKVEYRINATNSGIQIRSVHLPAGTPQGRGSIVGNWVL